jgi:hypothetical protein
MIHYCSGDVYKSEEVDIIFNPVGVRDNSKGFIKKVKKLYPEAYEQYNERVWMYSVMELMGDIQLVYIDNGRFVFNAFCKDRNGNIDKLAFTKTLVEICNLCHEYHASLGIEYALGVQEKPERKWLSTIIKETFRGVDDVEVTVYDRPVHHKSKNTNVKHNKNR